IGRIAIPLTQYLRDGTYVGFDIVPHGIEWCTTRITPRYPNFTFFLADVLNKLYHPEGTQSADAYSFPFADSSFDFVILTSVFTHMLPRDLERYTAEIGRVLKPGGRCFCTAYLINEDARVNLESGKSLHPFVARPDGYWTENQEIPEASVAYGEDYLTTVF